MTKQTGQEQQYIYEIAEKPPQQHFEGNKMMSAITTLQQSLMKAPIITFIMNSNDQLL
jgi:hypothetical protein